MFSVQPNFLHTSNGILTVCSRSLWIRCRHNVSWAVGIEKSIFSRTCAKNRCPTRSGPLTTNVGQSWARHFLHTSNVCCMKMHHWTSKMAPQKHEIIKKRQWLNAFLKSWNFMILVIAEPPKWGPHDVDSWLSTFALKPPREDQNSTLSDHLNTPKPFKNHSKIKQNQTPENHENR